MDGKASQRRYCIKHAKQSTLRAEGIAGTKARRQEKTTPLEELKGVWGGAVGNEAGGPQSTQDLGGPGEDWGFVLRTVGSHCVVFNLFCFFNRESDLLQFEF